MKFKDFLGNEVGIGDHIFYSTTGRNAESRLCKVVRFTEKSMFVDVLKNNRQFSLGSDIIVKNSFIKVDYY